MDRSISHPTPQRRAATLVVAMLAGATLGAGCAPGGGDLGTVAPPAATGLESIEIPSPEPTPGSSGSAPPVAMTTVRAYFMLGSHTGDTSIVAVLRQVQESLGVGSAAMDQLLDGPQGMELTADPALYTDVPGGTNFLGLAVSQGIATVNLSSEFAAGGTTATIAQRYAQVVFTLTQFGTVKRVQFQLDGAAASAVTPDGLHDGPVDRADYVKMLPAIWVDQPAWGGALANPGIVSGLANVFEGQFRIRLSTAAGTILVDKSTMASCGTGCVGTFTLSLDYAVPEAGWGTIRVYELSARDGSVIHAVDYLVWLTPKG